MGPAAAPSRSELQQESHYCHDRAPALINGVNVTLQTNTGTGIHAVHCGAGSDLAAQ